VDFQWPLFLTSSQALESTTFVFLPQKCILYIAHDALHPSYPTLILPMVAWWSKYFGSSLNLQTISISSFLKFAFMDIQCCRLDQHHT